MLRGEQVLLGVPAYPNAYTSKQITKKEVLKRKCILFLKRNSTT